MGEVGGYSTQLCKRGGGVITRNAARLASLQAILDGMALFTVFELHIIFDKIMVA